MELGVPFAIVAFEANEATLRARIVQRQAGGRDASDADLAVLARQQVAAREPLTAAERAFVVAYDAELPLEAARAPTAWSELAGLLARQAEAVTVTGVRLRGGDDVAVAGLLMRVKVESGPAL